MVGSVGLSSTSPAPPSELETIYQGGPGFADRMKAFADQTADWVAKRDEAQKALAALNLGSNIAAVQASTKSAWDEANKAKLDAKQALADAQAQAARIVADAKAQGEGIVSAAISSASGIKADADAVRKVADNYAASTKKQAAAVLADAKAQQDAIAPKMAAAAKAQNDAEAAKSAADAATKAAQDAKKFYEDRVAKLHAVIAG